MRWREVSCSWTALVVGFIILSSFSLVGRASSKRLTLLGGVLFVRVGRNFDFRYFFKGKKRLSVLGIVRARKDYFL